MINNNQKYLITTTNWFYGDDGKQYRAVWGICKTISAKECLGIETNRHSTNWYVQVGHEDKYVIVAGCQIHYAIKCDSKPETGNYSSWESDKESKSSVTYDIPNPIYFTE